MNRMPTVGVILLIALGGCASPNAQRTDLNVAIFAWLPDAATAIEAFEDAFEKDHPDIDLDLELWDPYKDREEDDGLSQIRRFDVVEIDLCRFDDLLGEARFGGLDRLPSDLIFPPDKFVAPAASVVETEKRLFFVPHWVCGNFLMFWPQNQALRQAQSFREFVEAMAPESSRPVLADLAGSTTLGEFYADAVLDIFGPDQARAHFIGLASLAPDKAELFEQGEDAIVALAGEMLRSHRDHRSHYHDHPRIYPRTFAPASLAALVGYSERLYHVNRELAMAPKRDPLGRSSVVVRPFCFGKRSQGTPMWVDGFVVPRGRLSAKRRAIACFIRFALSQKGYRAFAKPNPWLPDTYLLPAVTAAYTAESVEEQPLLPSFQKALGDQFVIDSSTIWRGIKVAGKKMAKTLARTYPETKD